MTTGGVSINRLISTDGNLFSGTANPNIFRFSEPLGLLTFFGPIPETFRPKGSPRNPSVPLSYQPETAYVKSVTTLSPSTGVDEDVLTQVKGNPLPLFAMPTTFGTAKLSEPLSPMGL